MALRDALITSLQVNGKCWKVVQERSPRESNQACGSVAQPCYNSAGATLHAKGARGVPEQPTLLRHSERETGELRERQISYGCDVREICVARKGLCTAVVRA